MLMIIKDLCKIVFALNVKLVRISAQKIAFVSIDNPHLLDADQLLCDVSFADKDERNILRQRPA